MAASGLESLSPRERDVLRLVALGLTNAEIAARLDIRFETAKWHVSEILSKLGVESRDEAAAQWRQWRSISNRARRLARGLIPAGVAARIATVGLVSGAAVAAIAVVAVASHHGDDDEAAPVPASFHLEATYFDRRELTGIQLQPKQEAVQGKISWRQRGRLQFRIKTTDTSANIPKRGGTTLSDGTTVFFLDDGPAQSIRSQMPLATIPGGFWGGVSPGLLMNVGPLQQRSIDELVAWLERPAEGPERHAEKAGEDIIIGIRTQVITYGPTWVDTEHGTSGGVGQLWVDPATMFILQRAEEGADGSEARRYEVTSLEFGLVVPDSTFRRPAK